MDDRQAELLEGVSHNSKILELGPSLSPIAPRSAGWDVTVVDYATQEELIEDPNDFSSFESAVREVLAKPEYYRRAVLEQIRPRIEKLMAPENWWRRFSEATNL